MRFLASWRCHEPVLVFESDDWGLRRAPCRALLAPQGAVSEWADEQSESRDDLAALFDVLEATRDVTGRPGCWTPNFIVSNPDSEAIEDTGYERYVDVGIDRDGAMMALWREAMERRLVVPEYHGRAHLWPSHWLGDLRADEPGARRLLAEGLPALGFLESHPGYRSEYVDWRTGRELEGEALDDWLAVGLERFERAFGSRPMATIAPNYTFGPHALGAWERAGLRYVQAAGYQIRVAPNGDRRVKSTPTGERVGGLVALNRNVKLEPARGRDAWSAEAAVERILTLWRAGVPAVVDTHRFNYTGGHRGQGLRALAWLFERLGSHHPLFLTTRELGEACGNDGRFRDHWTGESRSLSVRRGPISRKALRALAELVPRSSRREVRS